jgi:lipoprotein-releasing system permease protein
MAAKLDLSISAFIRIYMISKMTISMKPEFFVWAVGIALTVNFVAGLYPAWKASRMDPVVAIGSA